MRGKGGVKKVFPIYLYTPAATFCGKISSRKIHLESILTEGGVEYGRTKAAY